MDGMPIYSTMSESALTKITMGDVMTYDGTLSRGISPWLVITGEYTQMTPSHEFLIIETQDWIARIQEIRMEDNLDAVRGRVEHLHAADLPENRVTCVVRHVVRYNGREGVALQSENATFEENLVFI